MTKDEEIIALAKEHKILGETFDDEYCDVAGLPRGTNGVTFAEQADILAFAKAIQEKQREEDANIAFNLFPNFIGEEISAAIRAKSPESDIYQSKG